MPELSRFARLLLGLTPGAVGAKPDTFYRWRAGAIPNAKHIAPIAAAAGLDESVVREMYVEAKLAAKASA